MVTDKKKSCSMDKILFFVTRKFNLQNIQISLQCLETLTAWLFTYFSFNILRSHLRWSEKICENFDHLYLFRLQLVGNETLYSYGTWTYIAKTEVKMFLTVIV